MSSGDSIRQRIISIVVKTLEVDITNEDIEDGATLDQLLGFDSVVAIEFILGLEKEFNITIEPEFLELETLADLNKLSSYIARRIKM